MPEKIEHGRLYTAREILALGVLPARDMRGTTRLLVEDKARSKPVLDAEIRGDKHQRRYYVLGRNIARYLRLAP